MNRLEKIEAVVRVIPVGYGRADGFQWSLRGGFDSLPYVRHDTFFEEVAAPGSGIRYVGCHIDRWVIGHLTYYPDGSGRASMAASTAEEVDSFVWPAAARAFPGTTPVEHEPLALRYRVRGRVRHRRYLACVGSTLDVGALDDPLVRDLFDGWLAHFPNVQSPNEVLTLAIAAAR